MAQSSALLSLNAYDKIIPLNARVKPRFRRVEVINTFPEGNMSVEAYSSRAFAEGGPARAPKPYLKNLNFISEVQDVKVEERKEGVYVDLTLPSGPFSNFQSTPLKMIGLPAVAGDIAPYLNASPKTFIMAVASNAFPKIGAVKFKRAEVRGPNTLRVWVENDHGVKTLHEFLETRASQPGLTLQVLFINYAAIPTSLAANVPPKKRETYFLHARNGLELKRVSHKGKVVAQVTFKDVSHVTAVNELGKETTYTDGQLAKAIGHGHHPFRPNGAFRLIRKGKESTVILSFDEAHFDPKTHNVTFIVDFLADPIYRGNVVVPEEFFYETTVSFEQPVTLFLDWAPRGGIPR